MVDRTVITILAGGCEISSSPPVPVSFTPRLVVRGASRCWIKASVCTHTLVTMRIDPRRITSRMPRCGIHGKCSSRNLGAGNRGRQDPITVLQSLFCQSGSKIGRLFLRLG